MKECSVKTEETVVSEIQVETKDEKGPVAVSPQEERQERKTATLCFKRRKKANKMKPKADSKTVEVTKKRPPEAGDSGQSQPAGAWASIKRLVTHRKRSESSKKLKLSEPEEPEDLALPKKKAKSRLKIPCIRFSRGAKRSRHSKLTEDSGYVRVQGEADDLDTKAQTQLADQASQAKSTQEGLLAEAGKEVRESHVSNSVTSGENVISVQLELENESSAIQMGTPGLETETKVIKETQHVQAQRASSEAGSLRPVAFAAAPPSPATAHRCSVGEPSEDTQESAPSGKDERSRKSAAAEKKSGGIVLSQAEETAVSRAEETAVSQVREVTVSQAEKTSVGQASQAEAATVAQAEAATVAQAEQATVAQAEAATVAQAEAATVAQAEQATVAQAEQATVAQAEAATVAQAEQATVAQAEAATVAQAEAATVAQAEAVTVAQAEAATVAQAEAATVAQAEAATVAQAEAATVAQAEEATVAQAEAATVAQAEAATVAQAEAATVAQAEAATVAQAEAATVAQAEEATVGQAEEATVGQEEEDTVQTEEATVGQEEEDIMAQAEAATVSQAEKYTVQTEEDTGAQTEEDTVQTEEDTVQTEEATVGWAEEDTGAQTEDDIVQAEEATVGWAEEDTGVQAEEAAISRAPDLKENGLDTEKPRSEESKRMEPIAIIITDTEISEFDVKKSKNVPKQFLISMESEQVGVFANDSDFEGRTSEQYETLLIETASSLVKNAIELSVEQLVNEMVSEDDKINTLLQ